MDPNEPSFLPNPPERGALSLLWVCLSTIFLCVWTAIHPNTPPQNSSNNYWSKGKWCVMILLFPELVFQFILTEFASARRFRNMITGDAGGSDGLPLIETPHSGPCFLRGNILRGRSNSEKWRLKHTYLLTMGALQFRFGEQSSKYLTEKGLKILIQYNMLPSVAFLNERIKRRRKSDSLSKLIVCAQVLWISIQTIVRQISELPITPLEYVTLAQIWFAICVYAVWWSKPQDLEDPIVIDFGSCSDCLQFLSSRGLDTADYFVAERPKFNFVESLNQYLLCFLTDVFVSFVYVGIHAWGWNATFATYAELILWRVAVCIFCVSLGMFGTWTLIEWIFNKGKAPEKNFLMIIIFTGLGCARVIFITEAFISLRTLPLGSWSDLLPHIG